MTKWPIAGECRSVAIFYARLDLVRSNGSVLKLVRDCGSSNFVTPDQYKIRATVRDGFGAGAVKLFDLPIVRNQLTIEKIIAASTDGAAGAAEMLRVYQPILFETNVVGGQGQVTCGIELQRANGTTIRKLNQSRLAWQFFTPGDYVIRVVAHSADGQEDIRAQTFTIAENPLVIDSFTVDETHVPKILTETALTVRHSGGYGRKSYAFFLVSPDGSLSELGTAARPNFSWTFLTPGEYTLNVRVEDELNHCAEGSCDLWSKTACPNFTGDRFGRFSASDRGDAVPLYGSHFGGFAARNDGGCLLFAPQQWRFDPDEQPSQTGSLDISNSGRIRLPR